MRAISVYMLDRFVYIIHDLDSEYVVEVFRLVVLVSRRLTLDQAHRGRVAAVLDPAAGCVCEKRYQHVRDILVHQQCFCRIACSYILSLGVDDDRDRLFDAGRAVDIHVAYAVSVTHHRDL